ncbi:putative serine/threonine-protein kinase Sps1 [Methyloglobulus morosus KoM1]|uniref:Putative serine/threonine-protein kinase Sps1 n=1 Tax=Methyloglobulus morosus KoM1 TaxID=1116472 RepID=V5BBI3_9GAMM|nr:serine/threonine-protein kinase [Methyloglobulus morosus]ESS70620.1 putative serine/threonine-protein kinase Sps1 [Methyloglobulus morosus KoM1]
MANNPEDTKNNNPTNLQTKVNNKSDSEKETRLSPPKPLPSITVESEGEKFINEIDRSSQDVDLSSQIKSSADQSNDPKIGDLLNNRYRLEQELGQGGMGSVFKALDLHRQEINARNQYVAIKILLPALSDDRVLVVGFHREAEKSQKLTHPNIIKVFDASRDGNRHYMVMEYLEGKPLNNIISQHGAFPLKNAFPIISAIGRGLAHAHENNIIHSDLKPANVFILAGSNEVKILDFGIASELKITGNKDETIFNPRMLGGLTIQYASFEMLNGSTAADPRDDIYAFGLIVYELLTGKHPYNKKSASEVFLEQKRGTFIQPLPPKELTARQWQLLSQAISIEQDRRPKNLQKWLTAFEFNEKRLPRHFIFPIVTIIVVLISVSVYFLVEKNRSDISQKPKILQTKPPIANAGKDQSLFLGETIWLDGKASQSTDSGHLYYHWKLTKNPIGSQVVLLDQDTATPHFSPDTIGQYEAELTVVDSQNQTSQADTINIAVSKPLPRLVLNASKDTYYIGEYLQVNIHSSQDGYLGVVYLSSTGVKLQIFPNGYQENSHIKADQNYQIPPKEKLKMLKIQGPAGIDTIIAVFSHTQLPDLEKYIDENGNLSETLQQNDAIVEKITYRVIKNSG